MEWAGFSFINAANPEDGGVTGVQFFTLYILLGCDLNCSEVQNFEQKNHTFHLI